MSVLFFKHYYEFSGLASLGLFITAAVLFTYTIKIRAPWFGTLSVEKHGSYSDGHLQWLSGWTLRDAKAWYREGPASLDFASFVNPHSIEFPTLKSRGFYPSYPTGVVLPIYTMGLVMGTEPNASMLMEYNLANHFLIAFLLSLTVFLFLLQQRIDFRDAFVFSLIPIFLELFLPGPLYWHQCVFGPDQAVILPFVIFVFLEVIQDSTSSSRRRRVCCFVQGIVGFYGVFTDWLMVFVVLTAHLKRWWVGQTGLGMRSHLTETLKLWTGPLIALILYSCQIYAFNGFGELLQRFIYRAGGIHWSLHLDNDSVPASLIDKMFMVRIPHNFGFLGSGLLILTVFALARKIHNSA